MEQTVWTSEGLGVEMTKPPILEIQHYCLGQATAASDDIV
jgi:hypothetical protein